jgi:lipopolysaccharide/colanic/teichoic acid biosynthesis glycosyltransferase
VYDFFKRLLDLVAGGVILVLLVPVIPAIAIMIKLDSPGSVFFKQDRVGCCERQEVETLNEQDGPVFKIRSDPRVTPVGHFLRRSSLDEIPQIFNVLKGDMSLVGPRPHLPREVAQYEAWHRARLEVKPGITCLWQASGRSHVAFDEWMRLDIEYLKIRSWRTDVAILARTIPAVMARRGAY